MKTKTILILLCLALALFALSGCGERGKVGNLSTVAPAATAQATMNPTQGPMATTSPMTDMGPTMSPESSSTVQPMNSPETAGDDMVAAMTPAQAGKLAEEIGEAVERLSEVDDAEVVVSDNRVLVAVEFEDQYSAGLDERMKKMITEAVQKVDSTLTDVSITDDGTIYGQVKGLAEKLTKATGLDELADDFGDLWDRITGM